MSDEAQAKCSDTRVLFLNAWGMGCFALFLLSLGTAEYKYICALASAVLMAWAYRVGARQLGPCLGPPSQTSIGASVVDYLPVWVGGICLAVLALAPLLTASPKKYLAFVQALTGFRL